MKKILARFAAVLVLMVLASCASAPSMSDQELAQGCLVYGYLDMDGAPTSLRWLNLKKVSLSEATTYWGLAVLKNRYFFHEGLPLGSYQINAFGGHSSLKQTDYTFQFGAQEEGFRLKDSGTHFMGSWKFIKGGNFFHRKFNVEPISKPTEYEVLKALLPKITTASVRAKAEKRLAELDAQQK